MIWRVDSCIQTWRSIAWHWLKYCFVFSQYWTYVEILNASIFCVHSILHILWMPLSYIRTHQFTNCSNVIPLTGHHVARRCRPPPPPPHASIHIVISSLPPKCNIIHETFQSTAQLNKYSSYHIHGDMTHILCNHRVMAHWNTLSLAINRHELDLYLLYIKASFVASWDRVTNPYLHPNLMDLKHKIWIRHKQF